MRFVFTKELIKYAKKNKNVFLITSDLGYRTFEKYKKLFPDRFINAGVSENNMIGISAGLAMSGKKVFVYSILPFVVFRSLEQIRNNICHNNLDVKIIGGGGGFSYNVQGISHNTSEDISIMRSLPNLSVFNPASKIETELVMKIILKNKSPCFLRLGKAPQIDFHKKNIKLNNKKGLVVCKGRDLTVFCTGNILENVNLAIRKLNKMGKKITLISLPILKPISEKFVLQNTLSKNVVTIEENVKTAGLSSLIASIYIKNQLKGINFKSISLDDKVHNLIGTEKYLRKINDLDELSIYKVLRKHINEKNI
jgi:transketolase